MNAALQLGKSAGMAAACRLPACPVPRCTAACSLLRHSGFGSRQHGPWTLQNGRRRSINSTRNDFGTRLRSRSMPPGWTKELPLFGAPCIASWPTTASKERRNQLRHPQYKKPELPATGPNQVWSCNITKLVAR